MIELRRTILVALALLWSTAAMAQVGRLHMAEFEAGSAAQQLALDGTVVQYGDGAVFVPSRSRPELEPQVRVLLGDAVVARGPTGRRLPVPAGQYRLMIGQGPEGWRATTTVTVEPGETTVADDFFGSLRVTAVDPTSEPVAVRYTLVSADGLRIYGPTRTSEQDEYESTRTWILRPGSYRIVPGDSPSGTVGTVATVVSADQRARVRLLVDGDGDVVGSEPGDLEPIVFRADWRFRWVVGGGGSLGQSRGQLNGFSGDSMRLDLFSDMGVTFDRNPHHARFVFGVEQSWVGFTQPFGRDLPFQKLDDLLRAELEYTFRLARIVGPYVRVTLRTALAPKTVTGDRDYTIITTSPDGSETTSLLAEGEDLRLLEAFSPLIIQEGAGMSFTIWDSRVFRAGLGAGVAARQTLYQGDGRYLTSREEGTVRFQALDDSYDWGPEGSAWLRLQLGRWVALRTQAYIFIPMDAVLSNDVLLQPVFLCSGSLSLRLSHWASLVYSATLHRDDAAIEELQYRHLLNLRFQYSIF